MPNNSLADWSPVSENNEDVGGVELREERMRVRDTNGAVRNVIAQVAELFNEDVPFTAAQQDQARDNFGVNERFRHRANSLTSAATLNLANVDRILVDRYSNGSTVAPAVYVKVGAEPSHDLKFQDSSAAWFEIDFEAHPAMDWRHGGADPTGDTDSFAAVGRVLEAYTAHVGTGVLALASDALRGCTFRIDWDGATGDVPWGGGSATGLNNRYCFKIEDHDALWMDLRGITLLHGGEEQADWSTVFRLHNIRGGAVLGGTYDYVNLPFFQGTVDAIGADYVDVALEAGCPAPTFTTVNHVEPRNSDRVPNSFGIKRSPFTETAFTLADQGGGVWRISGFTADELTQLQDTRNAVAVGTLVVARGATDGQEWFLLTKCENFTIAGYTCHTSADGFAEVYLSKNVSVGGGGRIVERPGTILTATTMRAGVKLFNVGGRAAVKDTLTKYTGDDGLAIGGAIISGLTYVSGTSFTGFMTAHWWSATVDAGDHFILRTPQGVEQARCTITAVGTASGSDRTFTFTVDSGSIPADLTDYYAAVEEYTPVVDVEGNGYYGIRGRAIYAGAKGRYSGNRAKHTTGPGMLLNYGQSAVDVQISEFDTLIVTENNVEHSCVDPFYVGGVVVRQIEQGTDSGAVTETSTAFPIKDLLMYGNIVKHTPNAAYVLAGVDGGLVFGNYAEDVASVGKAPNWIASSYGSSVLTDTVFAFSNCRDIVGFDNFLRDYHGAAEYKAETENGGTSDNIRFGNNHLLDSTSVTRLTAAEASGQAAQELKNENFWARLFAGDTGLWLASVAAGVSTNRWQWDTSWNFRPAGDNLYDLGAGSHRPRTVYSWDLDVAGSVRLVCDEYTAAEIASAAHAVNTTGKFKGVRIWDTTNRRELRARAGNATSPWDVVGGSASVTPV